MGCAESRESAPRQTSSAQLRSSHRRSARERSSPADDPSPAFSPLTSTLEPEAPNQGASRVPGSRVDIDETPLGLPDFIAPVTGLPRDHPSRRGRNITSAASARVTASPRHAASPPQNPLASPPGSPRHRGLRLNESQQLPGATMSMDSTPIDQWLDGVAHSESSTVPRGDAALPAGSPSSSMVLTMRRSASQKLQAALRREMGASGVRA